jgi:hypothetical protein
MNIAGLTLSDLAGVLVGAFLTLSVFSYLMGDNALFRLATHIFIGVSSAYIAVATWFNVIWPKLILPVLNWEIGSGGLLNLLIPLFLSLLLLFKLVPRLTTLGSPVMAYLVGIGAATAIGGAVMGTLFPQVAATINLFDNKGAGGNGDFFWLLITESSFILLGTLSALIYFHFGARSPQGDTPQRAIWIDGIANIGKFFIAVTFGALFAGVLTAALTALVERWNFILTFILSLFSWLI